MSLVDKHFKDALRDLPEKKLSWQVDRQIRKMIRQRAAELDGHKPFWVVLRRLVAVPVALALLLTTMSGYAYYSPAVVQGDFLYPIKSELENRLYPESGTSEERIAYHLWLSERRYAEVAEILERKSRQPLSLVPAVYAQELNIDPLDAILLETLQRATQHVEYAFLVTDEIRDVERVQEVKEQILDSIRKQREMLEEIVPALEKVKLEHKPKARVEVPVLPLVVGEVDLPSEVEPPLIETVEEPVEKPTLELPESLEKAPEGVEEPLVEEPVEEPLEEPVLEPLLAEDEKTVLRGLPLVESFGVFEEVILENMHDLVEDRLAFQEQLFEKLEGTLEEAVLSGEVEVVLETDEQLEEIPEEELIVDDIFTQALTVHYGEEQKVVRKELKRLDERLVAELKSKEGAEVFFGEFPVLVKVPAEILPPVIATLESEGKPVPSVAEEVSEPTEEPVVEVVIEEPVEILVVAEEEQPIAEEVEAEAVLEVAGEPSHEEREEKRRDREDGDEDSDGDEDHEDDLSSLRKECEKKVRELCREFGFFACLDRLLERCEEVTDKETLKELLERAEDRMEALQDEAEEEKELIETMIEKRERLEELDEKLERIEASSFEDSREDDGGRRSRDD